MIKLLTPDRTNEFISFCKSTVLGSVILTKLLAYGLDTPIQYFWYGESDGKITSVLNLDASLLTVSGMTDSADELFEFIRIIGANSVYSDVAPEFKIKSSKRDEILIFKRNTERAEAENIDSESIKNIFPVIYEECPTDGQKIIFGSWYPDISLKIRRGLIRSKGIMCDDKLVSCAVTCAENEMTAVITGVATLKKYRRNGFAKKCVIALANELKSENKRVYLITDNEKTKKWYKKMGFEHFSYRYSYEL